ncbi:MAG: bifunctional adenosylcobinamide kinase/adenosylcobinamide-phosphate guanylyltransferase, partial [Planctomycetota bacterium]
MSSSPDGPTLRAPLGGAALHLDLGAEHDAVGWTVLGGGRRTVRRVDWWLATSDDLLPGVDAREWVRERVTAAGGGGGATAAFLTSRRLDAHVVESAECEHGTVRAVATVGLGNALTAGDDATPHRVGTINVAVVLPCPCTEEAMLETLGLASEAKCIAVLDAGMRSVVSARRATGTGTDALVVLAPAPSPEGPEERQPYAGKHTTLGAAVGRAVEGAVRRGARDWLREADVPFPPDPAGRRGRGRVVLVGGGVRSGKSAFAESLVLAMSCRHPAPPTYLATAQAWDDEMRDRIARHQADRGERFSTLEVPMDLPEELRAIS